MEPRLPGRVMHQPGFHWGELRVIIISSTRKDSDLDLVHNTHYKHENSFTLSAISRLGIDNSISNLRLLSLIALCELLGEMGVHQSNGLHWQRALDLDL